MVTTPEDTRKYTRRRHERRIKERRAVGYPFGSPEWLERVQKDNVLWPKHDRRYHERRQQDRRKNNRRTGNIKRARPFHLKNAQDLLTEEEKQLLNELMRSDSSP